MAQKLGEVLIEKKLITETQLNIALDDHKKTGDFLGTSLVKLGFITEKILFEILSVKFKLNTIKLKETNIDNSVISNVPVKFVRHYKFMPLSITDNKLTIAITNPFFLRPIDDIKLHLGYDVEPVLASEKDIRESIKKYYGIGADTIQELITKNDRDKHDAETTEADEAEDIEKMAGDASVIKLVSQILKDAINQSASDIHIEIFRKEVFVRYRIDGILYDTKVPEDIKYLYSAMLSRIKIISGLDIVEKRIPQDGRAKVKMMEGEWELRVSIIPTLHGENVVIRVLPMKMLFNLDNLGLYDEELEMFNNAVNKPHGIIFLTGPTGSGKTTTLYGCLSKINTSERKIITIEDPVEYELKGISQIQVTPKVNLTFASALRSILRHDPDVVMVGEVRDSETADITIRTALTGHLVFSTLHTNDAATGVARLIDMGVEPFLVASSVNIFIAQRLIRKICQNCKEKIDRKDQYVKEIEEYVGRNIEIFQGKGCDTCRGTGYQGRTALYEFLPITDDIKKLIIDRVSASVIKDKAIELNMTTLKRSGWKKVADGLTTIEEVLRVS